MLGMANFYTETYKKNLPVRTVFVLWNEILRDGVLICIGLATGEVFDMNNWLKENWRWAALNGLALAVMLSIATRPGVTWNTFRDNDPVLEAGKWGLRFLLISMAVTPLSRYFGWRSLIPLRKPAGLWAFGFGALHYLLVILYDLPLGMNWLTFPLAPFITLGLISLLILAAMALTSNQAAMKALGKNWKRLHRLVYVASLLIVIHALLATQSSKKLFGDDQAKLEITIYLAVLLVLLLARLPLVRNAVKRLPMRRYGTA